MLKTKLNQLAKDKGGKFVPFAGYEMPINFTKGIIHEHLQTRNNCGVFDVSHMGQLQIFAKDKNITYDDISNLLKTSIPSDFTKIKPGQMKYSVLLNEDGGIIDDLILSRPLQGGEKNNLLNIVLNSSRKDADFAVLNKILSDDYQCQLRQQQSLIAVQGPLSREILCQILPDVAGEISDLTFMKFFETSYKNKLITICCCGYTGEDGFEISMSDNVIEEFTSNLLNYKDCEFVGLGARDSLRLEAGLCLYGQDLREDINPIEASIKFVIPKTRFVEGDFHGAKNMQTIFAQKTGKRRVGIKIMSKSIARPDCPILLDGQKQGYVSSGGYSPVLQCPIAFAYINKEFINKDKIIEVEIRGKLQKAEITSLPFVPVKYKIK